MADPDTVRGWQNVVREIRRKLNLTRQLPDEPQLHPVEVAEREAWQAAETAVLNELHERSEGGEPELYVYGRPSRGAYQGGRKLGLIPASMSYEQWIATLDDDEGSDGGTDARTD